MAVVDGDAILRQAADAYQSALGERLLAAYALGSLAHGGFSPLVSDIDLGLIVGDPLRPTDAEAIQTVADAERAKGCALCQRLSVFWGTRATLRGEREGGRFPPLDRLDLLEHGRLLIGNDAREGIPRPSADRLVLTGAEFALDFLAGFCTNSLPHGSGLGSLEPPTHDAVEEIRTPQLLLARGVRRVTKIVLFPVRFLFTAATGRVGTNAAAVFWYLTADEAPGTPLVAAALAWRAAEPVDQQATLELLGAHLIPLYLHYINDQIARLDALGRNDLGTAFKGWGTRLTR